MKGRGNMELVGFFVICIIIAVISGNDDCLSGVLVMRFGVAITIGAFAINPILGIIVGYLVLQGWKNM